MLLRALALLLVTACGGAEDARARPAAGERANTARGDTARTDAATATPPESTRNPLVARADSARIRGSAGAPVWLIVASDFQCPYCRLWHESTDHTIRREYIDNGRVRMAFINFPLSNHQHALPAAEYAMCAGAQGKFWEVHDGLFATQEQWTGLADASTVFDDVARKSGVDLAALGSCVSSHLMRPLIEADRDRALRSGVRATPSFFIGNQKLEGVQSADDLRKVLDAALAAAKR